MLRQLLILGICAGSSASVPILYQSNPEAFHRTVQRLLGAADEAPPHAQSAPVVVARAQPVEAPPLGRKVRLAADERGHFVAEFRLNGRRIEAMVDTGATLVALNASTARRIGLSITQADFSYTVQTANGTARAAGARIDRLQIGRIEVENVDAVVLEDRALADTLIGISFLDRLSKYGVQNGTLLLEQ